MCSLPLSFLFFSWDSYILNVNMLDIGEGNGTPLQYSCPENPTDAGAWKAAVHGVAKSWTRLGDFTFTFHFRALEKEVATHSSVLAWRIPGTGEPGGLLSMGVTHSRTRLKRLSSSSSSEALEKTMAIHSSTLAWKIPWMEEPGRLQSMGSLSWA